MRYRRTIGLFSFFYALLHMINFVLLDMELDIASAINETLDKSFIYLGMFSFLLLLFMALTSTKVLFAKFYRYHRVIYIAITLLTIHFIMAQKSLSIEQWALLAVMVLVIVVKVVQRGTTLKI